MNYDDKPEMEDPLDRYLDRALSAYSGGEPRFGLEQRVLAHVQSAPPRRPWWIWLRIPSFVLLVLLVSLYWFRLPPVPEMARNLAPGPPVIEQRATKNGPVLRVVEKRNPRAVIPRSVRVSMPKLPTFPSAQPLSEQERLLVALAQNHPEQLSAIAEWQKEFTKPPDPEALRPDEDGE